MNSIRAVIAAWLNASWEGHRVCVGRNMFASREVYGALSGSPAWITRYMRTYVYTNVCLDGNR